MSIEALLQAQIDALKANTEAVLLLESTLVGRAGGESRVAAAKKESKEAVKEPVKETAKVQEEPEPEDDIPEFGAVAYETVRALVLKLAPTQREAIKALNARHGIANLKVLLDKEDDFSTVNDQVKLEAVYADLQALEA